MDILPPAPVLGDFQETKPVPFQTVAALGWVVSMGDTLMFWSKNLLVGMFFTGLIGCVSVVLFSWVSILKSAFSEKPED